MPLSLGTSLQATAGAVDEVISYSRAQSWKIEQSLLVLTSKDVETHLLSVSNVCVDMLSALEGETIISFLLLSNGLLPQLSHVAFNRSRVQVLQNQPWVLEWSNATTCRYTATAGTQIHVRLDARREAKYAYTMCPSRCETFDGAKSRHGQYYFAPRA